MRVAIKTQSHQKQGTSFSNLDLASKAYNGEWAFVGESVQQPAQFAFGEFRHPALREYHPCLVEAVRTAGMTWKKDPSERPCYVNHPLPTMKQPWVLCERCRLKRRDAKQRDDSESLGVVIHRPPQQQRSMRSQTLTFKCRQAILKRPERYRSKWSGEDARR